MTDSIVTLAEGLAMGLYLIAICLCVLKFQKSSENFQMIYALIMITLFMGALVSLADVLQWYDAARFKAVAALFERMEEVFTPIYAFLWLMVARTVIVRSKSAKA